MLLATLNRWLTMAARVGLAQGSFEAAVLVDGELWKVATAKLGGDEPSSSA